MQSYIKKFDKLSRTAKWFLLLTVVLFAAMSIILMAGGENNYVRVHDYLDSTHVWLKLLASSGEIFGDSLAIIPNMMGGLYRFSYPSEWNIMLWMHYFLPDYYAFVLNEISMHFVAFIGMFLLLRSYFITDKTPNADLIVFPVSLMFAFVPFWPGGGLSIAAQPLMLYAFLNIRERHNAWYNWFIIMSVPFYSSVIFSFAFFMLIIFGLIIYDLCRKQLYTGFFIAFVLTCLLFLFLEYRTIYAMFYDSGFISHRTEFNLMTDSFYESYQNTRKAFTAGHLNAPSMQMAIVLPLIFLGLLLSFVKRKLTPSESRIIIFLFVLVLLFKVIGNLLENDYGFLAVVVPASILFLLNKTDRLAAALFFFLVLSSVFAGFYTYTGMKPLADEFGLIKTFNFSRFYTLHTMAFFLLLALAMKNIIGKLKYAAVLITLVMMMQLTLEFFQSNFESNGDVTYKHFYDTKLFDQIKRYINKDPSSYRVVSLGFLPSVALYNGFYTVDGYITNYSLAYKHEFKKVIAGELEKNATLRTKFDDWGSTCFLYADEAPLFTGKKQDARIYNLDLNAEVLADLGTEYLFSTYRIVDPKGLKLLGIFENYWKIYLYQVEIGDSEKRDQSRKIMKLSKDGLSE